MKFLIFNLTVAAALFYLVTADRAEFQAAAGRVHDVAGEIKSMAEDAVDKGRKVLDEKTSRAEPAPAMMPVETAEKQPQARTPAEPPPPAPEAAPEIAVAKAPVAAAPVAVAIVTDPAVAKRRDEILGGVAAEEPGFALKEGARMMTPAQRRRELFNLAEEMELLYARTVSR